MAIISTSQIVQIWPVVAAVTLNLSLTVGIWMAIYGMKTDVNTFFLAHGNHSTGSEFYDGMANGAICLVSFVLLSFVMLTLALYNFRRVLETWLIASCVLINFIISARLFRDMLRIVGPTIHEERTPLIIVVALFYGIVGCTAFFTKLLPEIFHQFFVIVNCSMISLFYLRTFPHQTSWFVLVGVTLWDVVAVLAPFGPLRCIAEKATDYNESVLRMLMFHADTGVDRPLPNTFTLSDKSTDVSTLTHKTATDASTDLSTTSDKSTVEEYERSPHVSPLMDVEEDVITAEVVESDNNTSMTLTSGSMTVNAVMSPRRARTAHDALQDANVTRLGMGDFVFYSVLVGQAATSGSVAATLAAAVGVLVGLVITLTIFPDYDNSIPALPVPTLLGMLLHFVTLLVVEPLVGTLAVLLLALWNNNGGIVESIINTEL